MTDVLMVFTLLLTAFMATTVVLTRDPARQAIVLSGYGLVLAILFVVLQAPDVSMSQTGVGTVVVPLLVMLAIHAIRRHHTREADDGEDR
ncbi:Na(+)/H(+) antiporter subunit B [Nonomuraea sp. NPDC003201]